MKDKNDSTDRAKDTVLENVGKMKDEASKLRSSRVAGSSSDVLSSIRPKGGKPLRSKIPTNDLGELDDLDDSDFSFVPKRGPEIPVKAEPGANGPDQRKPNASRGVSSGEPEVISAGASHEKEVAAAAVSPRSPKVQPVRLDSPKVSPSTPQKTLGESSTPSSPKKETKTPEPLAQETPVPPSQPKMKSQPSKEKSKESKSSLAPTSEATQEEPQSKAQEMEVVSHDEEETKALSHASNPTKAVSKWAFWKRASHRDAQLAQISDGYLEMVDLVRAIRGQLESQNENNIILRDSLAHLPEAMKGLDNFSKSQEAVGDALQEIHGQMRRSNEKDSKLVDSMDGFNTTLQGMDVTNRATMKTFDRVHERMGESDSRMENLFENVQESEGKVSDTIVRLQRNMAIMQGIFLVCLLIVIGVFIFFVMKSTESVPVPTSATEPITQPVVNEQPPAGVTPREAREVGGPMTRD